MKSKRIKTAIIHSTALILMTFLSPFCFGADCSPDLKGKPTYMVRADYDADGIYIYQAFTNFTAENALKNQTFVRGKGFNFGRMTWLKLSFGWMLHRSNYANSSRQERILRIKISHEFFRKVLSQAIASHYPEAQTPERAEWQKKVKETEVVYQWDPDRDIHSRMLSDAVLQLGIRGQIVKEYAESAILEISDVTSLVKQIETDISSGKELTNPYKESEYPVPDNVRTLLSM